MKIREPLTHWDNFTIPELKEILEQCAALKRIGIPQDEEIIRDIERDITLREERKKGYVHQAKIIRKPAENPEKRSTVPVRTNHIAAGKSDCVFSLLK